MIGGRNHEVDMTSEIRFQSRNSRDIPMPILKYSIIRTFELCWKTSLPTVILIWIRDIHLNYWLSSTLYKFGKYFKILYNDTMDLWFLRKIWRTFSNCFHIEHFLLKFQNIPRIKNCQNSKLIFEKCLIIDLNFWILLEIYLQKCNKNGYEGEEKLYTNCKPNLQNDISFWSKGKFERCNNESTNILWDPYEGKNVPRISSPPPAPSLLEMNVKLGMKKP